jgi:hypothetical protein
MLIIRHRVNTIDLLRSTSRNIGVEIDVRCCGGKLFLAHDAGDDGVLLDDYLKNFQHKFIIFNIKDQGIESHLMLLIEKYRIEDYFLLDQCMPYLIKNSDAFFKNTAMRFSEYEPVQQLIACNDLFSWVWLDCFTGSAITDEIVSWCETNRKKICVVAPELQNLSPVQSSILTKDIINNLSRITAICTKEFDFWSGVG